MTSPARTLSGADGLKILSVATPEKPLRLDSGRTLEHVDIAYETWGTLNPARDNAILVFTGLSPSAHAASSASMAFNLNTCTADDLVQNIPGCFQELAESIVRYRTKIGSFKRLEDLALDVIGEAIRRVPARTFIAEYEAALAKAREKSLSRAKGRSKG